jgi:hypothetical protein
MEITLDLPWYKRWAYGIAGASLYPTIISAMGFAYIGIPESLQITIRRWIPEVIREHMLFIFTTSSWFLVLLALSVLCLIWGGVGSHVTLALIKKKFKALFGLNETLKQESESKSINCYRLFSNWLYSYSTHLRLTTGERVSLYKLDMNMFSCIGRYSENEIFNSKPTRLYPREQGGLSRAWEVGVFENTEFPDPEENLQAWTSYNMENYNFTKEELLNIRMKSRAFYGVRLKNYHNTTVAVILFESLKPNGLSFGKLKRLLNDQEKMNLTALIESLKEHIPTLEAAREEGF